MKLQLTRDNLGQFPQRHIVIIMGDDRDRVPINLVVLGMIERLSVILVVAKVMPTGVMLVPDQYVSAEVATGLPSIRLGKTIAVLLEMHKSDVHLLLSLWFEVGGDRGVLAFHLVVDVLQETGHRLQRFGPVVISDIFDADHSIGCGLKRHRPAVLFKVLVQIAEMEQVMVVSCTRSRLQSS
jgi:hypothetical protein